MKNDHPMDSAHEVLVLILESHRFRQGQGTLPANFSHEAFSHRKSTTPTPFPRPKSKTCCPAATVAIEVIFAAFGHGPIAARLPRHRRRLRRHWLTQGGSWPAIQELRIPTSGYKL